MSDIKQISLFDDNRGVVEIRKHSALVAMNNITTLQQRKSMNALLLIAKDQLKRQPDKRVFTIDLGQLKRLAGISRNDNKELKAGLKSLLSLVIEYNILHKDKNERGAFPFLSLVKIEGATRGNTATLNYELPSPMLDAVKNPRMYVKLDLFILRGLSSKYSLALYESIKDYQNLGAIRIEIENLRKLMGIKEGQYAVFTMFRKRVLDVAVAEINEKTDIDISFELERKGRKVVAVSFVVSALNVLPNKEAINKEVTERLQRLGIKDYQIAKLIEKHDEDYILANIAVVENELERGKNIKNIPWYLLKAFQVDFRPSTTEFEEKIVAEKQEEKAKEQQEVEELEQLERQYNKQKNKLIETHLEELSPTKRNALKSKFIAEIEQSDFLRKIYEKKGFDYHAVQSSRYKFIGNDVLPDFLMSFYAYKAAQKSKTQMDE